MTIDEKSPSRGNTAVGIVIAIIVIISIIGIWLIKNQSSGNDALRRVSYEVTSDGGYAQVIYTVSKGVNSDPSMVTTPFSRTVSLPVGSEVFLTASNPSQNGSVMCKIRLDGKDWKESHGTHPVDSVACGGIIK